MSYGLIYDKCGIKIEDDLYLPLIKYGSNNVWECNGKKRFREWCIDSLYQKERKILYTSKELLEDFEINLKKSIEKETDINGNPLTLESHFEDLKINYKYAKYKDLLNLQKNMIKKAIPLEEFLSRNHLEINYSSDRKENNSYTVINNKKDIINLNESFINDLKVETEYLYVDINLNWYSDSKIRKIYVERKPREKKEYQYCWVIYNNYRDAYYRKRSRYHYFETYSLMDAKKFKTEKSALKYLEEIKCIFKDPHIVKRVEGKFFL